MNDLISKLKWGCVGWTAHTVVNLDASQMALLVALAAVVALLQR